MFISIFDLFKVGIGPSSSHTMGPMVAAERFLERISTYNYSAEHKIRVTFYGSLAFTGKGHASDRAVILGLAGEKPDQIDPDAIESIVARMKEEKRAGGLIFDPEHDIVFDFGPALEAHPNGMIFCVLDENGASVLERTYYSIGGGFVLSNEEMTEASIMKEIGTSGSIPYPYNKADELLAMGEKSGLSIAEMILENEKSVRNIEDINQRIDQIWRAMSTCIDRGLDRRGVLPGDLGVKRRASAIKEQLDDEKHKNSITPHVCNEWLSVYAMAVNEENAAGGSVVTAPTNGAAGVIPAVLRYYLDFVPAAKPEHIPTFLLSAAAIGGIIKKNASISGAEVGCQGEVGSASSMAAAGLCAVMGGTNAQIENAAEIALEHHLGMTCDPVGGLVQVPCIERNGLGAVKAVTAAALSLRGTGEHFVSLDSCIETMRQTGKDMNKIYKETSQGGLAVNVIEC